MAGFMDMLWRLLGAEPDKTPTYTSTSFYDQSTPPAPHKPASVRTSPEELDRENREWLARQRRAVIEAPFDWFNSESGNPTCTKGVLNATVFRQDGGFKHVINYEGGDRSDAVFSKRFMTEEAAIQDAQEKMLAILEGIPTS